MYWKRGGGVGVGPKLGIAGLWWVEHRDRQGELIAELLEVTRVPELLASAVDEIAAGGRALRARIAGTTAPMSRVASPTPLGSAP